MDEILELFEEIYSDDEEDFINIIEMPRNLRNFKVRPNQMEQWSDTEFLNRFRLSKDSVENLLQQIQHLLIHPTQRFAVISIFYTSI